MNTGANITVMGAEVFKKVGTVAKLRKSDLETPEKKLVNYDQTPVTILMADWT